MSFTPFAADVAAQRRQDLHRDADAWRRQQSLRRRRARTRPHVEPLRVIPSVLNALRRVYDRGQLGPASNYVVQ